MASKEISIGASRQPIDRGCGRLRDILCFFMIEGADLFRFLVQVEVAGNFSTYFLTVELLASSRRLASH